MLISNVSIRRPVFATMLNLVLIVFGLFALPKLAIDQYPDVDFPIVTVSIIYPGADPESVEQRILDPIEKAVNGISGLDQLTSNAYPNLAQIILKFKLSKNSDQAAQEVRDKVFAAVGNLPTEAKTPIVQKFDIGGAPILNIALTSKEVGFGDLSSLVKDKVLPVLERVNGVASITTAGSRLREVHVNVDRKLLSSFGLSPSDVINSIQMQNLDMPTGKVENDSNYWTLRVKGKLSNAKQISLLPVLSASPMATNLRISDVATVTDTIAEEETAAFIGDTPTILMSVQKQSGSNTTKVAEETRAAITNLGKELPKGVSLEVVSDNSRFIKGSIDSVKLDLLLGALLAVFIVFLFLRNFWITVISAVALPTAVIATFAFLQAMGFTLNMMTTLGLSLSIGILIDDAIIVIENIHRHLRQGKSGRQAAEDATAEIGLAVIATTLTICAVFVPVAFMDGIIGRFFYQFGLTVAFAVIISLFVAFTLSPMMSSRLLKEGHEKPEKGLLLRMWEWIENALLKMDSIYKGVLVWCLDHRFVTLLGGLAAFILSFILLRFVPVAFFPKDDKSQFTINYTLPEGTSLKNSKQKAMELVAVVGKYPGIEKIATDIGATRQKTPNYIRLNVVLVDRELRSFSQYEMMDLLRQDLMSKYAVNGAEFNVSELDQGGGGATEPIQFVFKSDNWEELIKFSDAVADFVRNNIVDAVDIKTTKPKTQKEFKIEVNSGRAADLGVSTAQIGTQLRALFEGDKVGEIEDDNGRFDVRLRISDQDRSRVQELSAITLPNRRGQQISLGALANISQADAPSTIERRDGQRQIMVLANFKGKDLNKASNQIMEFVQKNMPPSVSVALSGQTEIMRDSIAAMLRALAIAVLLVFMILCAQYERYLAPLIIMAALPLSFTGAFGALLLTGQIMSVFTMIGIILLMGIVTKNGILLIDFTLQRIQEGMSVRDALLEAGPIRLRPILMTTFAAGGGMLPIALGHGVGGESRSPMGVAVIGGLLMSTFLTLVVVPCLFSLMEQWRNRMSRSKA